MATFAPYKGNSQVRLTRLINATPGNTSNLELGYHFDFGHIEDYSDPDGRNTTAYLIPRPITTLTDDEFIHYHRLNIDVLGLIEQHMELVTIPALPFSIHEILPNINVALGLDLVPSEVADIEYDTPQSKYELQILPGSYAWLPSSYYFEAQIEGLDPIERIVKQTDLNGLVWHPEESGQ